MLLSFGNGKLVADLERAESRYCQLWEEYIRRPWDKELGDQAFEAGHVYQRARGAILFLDNEDSREFFGMSA